MKLTESGLRRLSLARTEVELVQESISEGFPPEMIVTLNKIVTSIISKN